MGILDEAIREHLELRRRHGAEQDELRQLEDEAFGPPERPAAGDSGDPAAEDGGNSASQQGSGEEPTRLMDWHQGGEGAAESTERDDGDIAGEGEGSAEGERDSASEGDADEQAKSAQGAEGDADEQAKREEIARQKTEHFDVLGEIEGEEVQVGDLPTLEEPPPPPPEGAEERIPGRPADEPEAASAPAPAAESSAPPPAAEPPPAEPTASEQTPAPSPPPDPTPAPKSSETAGFDEKLLSEELDHALEAPESQSRRASFFDDESDEYRVPQRPSRRRYAEDQGETEGEGEGTDGGTSSPGETGEHDQAEDVLEETPDFLEETPEHDRLWFEQKPPKDFDFND